MNVVVKVNDYVEPAYVREVVVQMIVDAFLDNIGAMEREWKYAEQEGLRYDAEDNGIYVYKSRNGDRTLISTMEKEDHIRVTKAEMNIAFQCLHQGGYYCYGEYNMTHNIHQWWWSKRPSFFGRTPIEKPTFTLFIG